MNREPIDDKHEPRKRQLLYIFLKLTLRGSGGMVGMWPEPNSQRGE
nr:MAG TPA: hypothetical protein [Caudoviricetes sp.]